MDRSTTAAAASSSIPTSRVLETPDENDGAIRRSEDDVFYSTTSFFVFANSNIRGPMPQEAAASSTASDVLRAGDRVELHSLKDKPEYNGKAGTLVAFDAESERWRVDLESGDSLTLKAGNLTNAAAWSAALLEAALVSGSVFGELTPCTIRSEWTKDIRLRLRFDQRLPAEVIQGITSASGTSMKPMVVVSGGADGGNPFRGIHRILQCDEEGTTVLCFVAKFEGVFEPKPFDIDPPTRPGSINPLIKPRRQGGARPKLTPLPKAPVDSGVFVDRPEMSAETVNARVTIAPPLVFHSRMSWFHLDEINTVAQTFRADVYFEFRLRGISSDPEEDLVRSLLDAYGFRDDMVEVMMAVDVIDQERWCALTNSSTRPGTFDYSLKLRVKAILAEQYELELFPFDEQDLHKVNYRCAD